MRSRPRLLSAALACGLCLSIPLLALASPPSASHGPAHQPPGSESPYLAENTAAMDRMMAAMEIQPSGDVDRDFVAMMVPHHQGAIDMAVAVLRHGRNEQIRRLAQEIIVTQQQEIAAMWLAVGEPLPDAKAAPTQVAGSAPSRSHPHQHLAEQP